MPTKRAATDAPSEETPAETAAPDAPVDEHKVRDIVREMLASLSGIGDGDNDDTDEPEPEADGKPAARTQAAVEADVESKVRAEIDKLRGEEDRDRRIAALESKTAEPERAPIKERVSTRLMGWSRTR